jgi:D-glycero-D-manno-heptose 1,7-bisphosphate phosphatase
VKILALLAEGGESGARLIPAAAGLAARGHDLAWAGGQRPAGTAESARLLRRRRDLWGFAADVVVSQGATPLRPAVAGWQAGASCLVMALDSATMKRWTLLDHWAWHSLHSQGLIVPTEADDFRAAPHGLDLDRLALWSDEPAPHEPDASHPDTEILERACERALARHRSRAPRPAVFLDRDGTLVKEIGYLADPDDLELLPGVAEALRGLRAAGYAIVVVSNQSGVGRGLFTLSRVHEAMARLRSQLRLHGVELDAVYFCPHRPDAGCACRKPSPGLLRRAAEDQHLSLRDSVMVGDKLLDVETAHRAGAAGVLVRTGYGRDEEQRAGQEGRGPDAVCADLPEAAAWILARPVA